MRRLLLMQLFEAREIGERIQQARVEAGLTQAELAELAPFSLRSLQNYEAGITVPYKHLRAIATLLNRNVEWFLHGEQEPSPADERIEELEQRLEARVGRVETLLIELLGELRKPDSRGSRADG